MRKWPAWLVAMVFGCAVALFLVVAPASAHVVPTSTIQLDVGTEAISARLAIPVSDVESATEIDLGDYSQADVDQHADAIREYLVAHWKPTSDDGQAWTLAVGALTVGPAGDTATTGIYQQLTTTATLTPPAGSDVRSFDLGYDAVVEKVATHVVIVTVRSDPGGDAETPYSLGTIRRDTVSNVVEPLHVDLSGGSGYRGLTGMIGLGMEHIRDGTDHQLFLLTLLLPAPLLARGRRWAGPVGGRTAVRRITTITLSFTVGHSITLALGALGVPVPQQMVESLIAASILVAALHAVRPIFPGREALVALTFGLVHGLAFSEALRALDLDGRQLVTSLLGFNLGIEAMQLVVVALVLPPLIVLARTPAYPGVQAGAAGLIALAATGWMLARSGVANPVASAADRLGAVAAPTVAVLWVTAAVLIQRQMACSPAKRRFVARAPTMATAGGNRDDQLTRPVPDGTRVTPTGAGGSRAPHRH